ncbi:MAG: hypothetical protein AUH29_17550 [Candidatus Rokubacteria bacterium 13_1_40CM_69_27]|nr:MAG: hypothetical protein AUH29_17550 [Candidatus Rokubacteria bacterium 13_1_40CM_69_27]
MTFRGLALVGVALAVTACATWRPLEQRTTQGPAAEEFWMYRVLLANGREPNFEERRHWQDQIDDRISRYLREHPEAANNLDVSTFRFYRRAAVGMSKEQITILLGPPETVTTSPAEMEKLARKYWPDIKGQAQEAWVYPLGWHLYFAESRLVDITQYRPR